ncbi:uncharacterized protein [Malus domestica]|uniref:uncharacterized protein n=1 Tax=Malus domestica TaxID=3750 RepID=UPI00397543CD
MANVALTSALHHFHLGLSGQRFMFGLSLEPPLALKPAWVGLDRPSDLVVFCPRQETAQQETAQQEPGLLLILNVTAQTAPFIWVLKFDYKCIHSSPTILSFEVIFANKLSNPCLLGNNSLNESVENLRENDVSEKSQNVVGESHDHEIGGYDGGDLKENVGDESQDHKNGSDLEENVGDGSQDHENGGDIDLNVDDDHVGVEENIESPEPTFHLNIYDPRIWDDLNAEMRALFVENGPIRETNLTYPKDKLSRKFSSHYYDRKLPTGEIYDRKWLVYSKELDKIFCFCCKLFKTITSKSELAKDGISDWRHLGVKLDQHEKSKEHLTNSRTWVELKSRFSWYEA